MMEHVMLEGLELAFLNKELCQSYDRVSMPITLQDVVRHLIQQTALRSWLSNHRNCQSSVAEDPKLANLGISDSNL